MSVGLVPGRSKPTKKTSPYILNLHKLAFMRGPYEKLWKIDGRYRLAGTAPKSCQVQYGIHPNNCIFHMSTIQEISLEIPPLDITHPVIFLRCLEFVSNIVQVFGHVCFSMIGVWSCKCLRRPHFEHQNHKISGVLNLKWCHLLLIPFSCC